MSKYKNRKIVLDGIPFDSIKEAGRYSQLKLLEKTGAIKCLSLQHVFILAPSVILNGRKKPPIKYIADFTYTAADTGDYIVEDVKSAATRKLPVYRLKAHLMKANHGVDIVEI